MNLQEPCPTGTTVLLVLDTAISDVSKYLQTFDDDCFGEPTFDLLAERKTKWHLIGQSSELVLKTYALYFVSRLSMHERMPMLMRVEELRAREIEKLSKGTQ